MNIEQTILLWVLIWFIMAKEIDKGKVALISILFMKIMGNRRKGR